MRWSCISSDIVHKLPFMLAKYSGKNRCVNVGQDVGYGRKRLPNRLAPEDAHCCHQDLRHEYRQAKRCVVRDDYPAEPPLEVEPGSWTLPYWPRVPAAPDGNLTIMALNTYYGWADPDRLMMEAERVRPDVVVLSEITHGTWDALRKRGWTELLPHHVGEPGDGWESHAMMIFSRHPLEQVAGDTDGAWATLRVAKPDGPCTVIAVHATNREHQPMREFADAAEQAGAGWVPTWPSRRYDRAITSIPYPSVIAIDHVLLGPGMAAAGFHTFTVARTDHRGIVTELAVSGWSGTGRRR